MTPNYEPSAELVEALAIEMRNRWNGTTFLESLDGCSAGEDWRNLARFVLRRQHERESLLNGAIAAAACELDHANEQGAHRILLKVMCDYAKLDAPKVPEAPTLLEAAKALTTVGRGYPESNVTYVLVGDWNALKAAVEREEKR